MVGAVFSTFRSVAKLPRLVAHAVMVSGQTYSACGASSLHLCLVLPADSVHADSVRTYCMPRILSPPCRAVLVPYVLLCALLLPPLFTWLGLLTQPFLLSAFLAIVTASYTDDAVPVGVSEFASELVYRSLSALTLPPASRVAGHCPLLFRPARGAEPEALNIQSG
jgi:hypothetical protein